MPKLITFPAALRAARDKKHLLIGNGFSVALFPKIFSYGSLLQRADFKGREHLRQLFADLKTTDFEFVIRALSTAAITSRIYGGQTDRIRDDAAFLKELLVTTVADNHPSLPRDVTDEQCKSARQFLSHFEHKFTLNYDLILYWVQMRTEVDDLGLGGADDGFRSPDNIDADYVIWDDFNSPRTHYLHGALHLFDDGDELQKYTWSRTNIPLMDQIRSALGRDAFPLFVSEGSFRQKLDRINHSGYLHKAFRSFRSCTGSLFVFGHSFSGDEHIFREISSSKSKYKSLFVSIYGDQNSPANKDIIRKVEALGTKRSRNPLNIEFFDADSAHIWS